MRDYKGTINKVEIMGRLGKDPELMKDANGKSLLKFNLATSKVFLKDGEPIERTNWIRIAVWNKPAEIIAKHAKKGTRLMVSGYLCESQWTDRNGEKKFTTEIIAENFQFVDGLGIGEKDNNGDGSENKSETPTDNSENNVPDDLPF
jgi:single-strand DNA-binding protein